MTKIPLAQKVKVRGRRREEREGFQGFFGEGSEEISVSMWESICLTLLATSGNNIGKVLQKKGTVILPPLSFKLKVIKAYAVNRLWMIGFFMDVLGALLMLKALAEAPVSVIQPVSGCGLAILSVFSHFYLKEVVNTLDWVGIALAGLGTIAVGLGGEEQDTAEISLLDLPWLVFSVFIMFVLMNSGLRMYKNRRREQELINYEVVEEIIIGLESGILFGTASVISKMGFALSKAGYSQIIVPACISVSICCSASGFVLQTRGLKQGRAIVVSTCAAVAAIFTGVLAGMLALGENLPVDPLRRLFLLLGWVMIVVGVVMLVSSTCLMGLVPRPLKRAGLKKTMSVRIREPGPSTVIHASTLHHLITSPAKEKA